MSIATEVRHAGLQDLVALLTEQNAAKVDVVAPAAAPCGLWPGRCT